MTSLQNGQKNMPVKISKWNINQDMKYYETALEIIFTKKLH